MVGLDISRIEALLDYKIIPCEGCSTRLRLPKNKARIRVTCPSCSRKFDVTT